MRAKQRYIAVAGVSLVLLGVWVLMGREDEGPSRRGESFFLWGPDRLDAPNAMGPDDFRYDQDLTLSAKHRREVHSHTVHKKKCTMETCFDYSVCRLVFPCFPTHVLDCPIWTKTTSVIAFWMMWNQ